MGLLYLHGGGVGGEDLGVLADGHGLLDVQAVVARGRVTLKLRAPVIFTTTTHHGHEYTCIYVYIYICGSAVCPRATPVGCKFTERISNIQGAAERQLGRQRQGDAV